jgi:hypothetical protein
MSYCRCKENREPTSGLEPLTPAHYECAVRCCWVLLGFADSVFLRGFLFPVLPTIAGHCVRVRVKRGQECVDYTSPLALRSKDE